MMKEAIISAILQKVKDGAIPKEEGVDLCYEIKNIPEGNSAREYARPLAREVKDIAIIGLAGRYPGARNLDEFWRILKEARDCITEIPSERWSLEEHFCPDRQQAIAQGKSYCKWGGFIDGVAEFDPLFFNITPKEAELLDPQERIFLETAWKAMEDAGYTRRSLAEAMVGVYVGVTFSQYQLFGAEEAMKGNIIVPSSSYASIANRLSYFCNFRGPSLTVDTMCSSSLTAIHSACESIYRGEIDVAIAGGVNMTIHPSKYIMLSRSHFIASDGRCRSFGENGDGYVPGEGVGVIMLKPLEQAIADGDHIYGLIKGSAVNHNGKTNGYTVPNPKAQSALIMEAIEKAGIHPREISYMEAHGTGTSLGDPIEIAGLTSAFKEYTSDTQYCAIGSVKSNIGHLEAAAGVAGITKVLLQMKNRQLVPSLHSEILNPNINFLETPYYVQQKLEDWEIPTEEQDGQLMTRPRYAGISSFGAGGSNAHLILAEYDPGENSANGTGAEEYLIVLSAKNEERLKVYVEDFIHYLDTSRAQTPDNIPLAQMAYTLQTGREAMEERLALVVTTIKELGAKLRSYLAGEQSERVYHNTLGRNKEAIPGLFEGQTAEEFQNIAIEKRDLAKLGQLWVNGIEINWDSFYDAYARNHRPAKISLPTYPFARERYWIPKKTAPELKLNSAMLHPLIDDNESTLQEQCFIKRLTGHEFFLRDHVIGGNKVLPGVAYIEMAVAAGGLSYKGAPVIRVENVVWLRPVIVGEQGEQIQITLFPKGERVEYQIVSRNSGGGETVYSEGRLFYGARINEKETIDIKAIQTRCNEMVNVTECYQRLAETGLIYGKSFRVMTSLFRNQTEMIAQLQLAPELQHSLPDYTLHLALLDGALQTISGFPQAGNSLYLPFGIKALEIIESLPEKVWVYTRRSNAETDWEAELYKFDILITDLSGAVLVKVDNFMVKKQKAVPEQESQVICYRSEFEKSEPQTALNSFHENDNILVFAASDAFCLWLKQKISNPITLVNLGETYREATEGIYQINPGEPGDYQKLIEALLQKGHSIHRIIHMTSVRDAAGKKELGFYSLFNLIQALMWRKIENQIDLIYVCEGGAPEYEGVSSFIRTLNLENPRYRGRALQLKSLASAYEFEKIYQELQREFTGVEEVVYQGDDRLVKRWKEIGLLDGIAASITGTVKEGTFREGSFREGGLYVITGGAGGLGLIFAEFLAKSVRCTIMLIGRSSLGSDKLEKIKAMESSGAKIEYRKMDVADPVQVKELVSGLKATYGRINGVIHAAGVIRDSFILKKERTEIDSVLKPKIQGIINFDEEIGNDSLDFMVLFSSTAAVLGNIGQSDYSYANGFLDHFAYQREQKRARGERQGKTISINWPLWRDGGMQVDKATLAFLNQRVGMVPLSVPNGTKTFELALKTPEYQLIAMEGDPKKLRDFFMVMNGKMNNDQPEKPQETAPNRNEAINREDKELKTKAENYLKALLSKETGIPVNRINSEERFENYGLDSVLIINLTDELEKSLQGLSRTIFFEYQTVKDLTRYLIDNHYHSLVEKLGIKESRLPETPERKQGLTEPVSMKMQETFRFMAPKALPEARGISDPVNEPIAIVGVSGRYPKAQDLDEFWEILKSGRDCITEISIERWDHSRYYDLDKDAQGKSYSKWGGFIDGFDQFDALFFNISPREAEMIDPQERLFLETVWHTIEDAGYTRKTLSGKNVGVYVGVMYGHYQLFGLEEILKGNSVAPGSSYASIANRVSYYFNFTGPSIALDTMCSSSITAIHLACESIRRGEIEMAIAGGVNLSIHPYKYVQLSQGHFVSSDGRCRSFGEGGDGYVPGEGVGAVMLLPLSQAIAKHDHIYGVIKSNALNHGGRTNGYTVPSPNAQGDLLKTAFKKAQIDPRTISYVEAHGTGTSLGDPIEITGLVKAFGTDRDAKQCCAIGSVKSLIGHLESAAGIAGITKVLLQLKYKKLTPSLHSQKLNPNINFKETPFYVQQELADWNPSVIVEAGIEKVYPRRAGISSFGAGGANAHLILEEYSQSEMSREEPEEKIFVLSARNKERLLSYAAKFLKFLKQNQDQLILSDLAYTLQAGREAMEERLAMVVTDPGELIAKLTVYFEKQEAVDGVYTGSVSHHRDLTNIILDGREGAEFIRLIIAEKNFDKLAQLWTLGVEIDWNLLYPGDTPQKISLPSYPFTRNQYWIPRMGGSKNQLPLSPMIDQIDPALSLQQGLVFTKEIRRTDRIVNDHVVGGEAILPGVGYLEMAYAALNQMKAAAEYQLNELIWSQPLVVEDRKQARISIKEVQGNLEFEIQTEGEENLITHARGYFTGPVSSGVLPEQYLAINNIKSRLGKSIKKEELYRGFDGKGISYGPYFQVINEISVGEGEALSQIELGSLPSKEFDDFILHPSVMDGALQTITGLLSASEAMLLPFSVGKVEILKPPSPKALVYVKAAEPNHFNIAILDETGLVRAKLHQVTLRERKRNQFYFLPRWMETGLPDKKSPTRTDSVVIVAPGDSLGLAQALWESHRGQEVVTIKLGAKNKKAANGSYEINTTDVEAIAACIQEIKDVGTIYFLGGIRTEALELDGANNLERLERSQEEGVLSLFRLIKALIKERLTQQDIILKIITNHTNLVHPDQKINPVAASLYGLAKSCAKEYPKLKISCIDIDLSPASSAMVLREIAAIIIGKDFNEKGEELVIRDGKCYQRELYPVELVGTGDLPVKDRGVYLILGGAGGIGLELAQHIAQKVRAGFILIGRSALKEEQQKKIAVIESKGSEVLYLQADATDDSSMREAVRKGKLHFGQINGAVHSAIVLKDKFLSNMDEQTFVEVLNPKVKGSFILYQVLKDEPLDFLLFFSSAQTFASNPGQSNYAAGCSFKDVFAEYLDSECPYPVKTINWGYWGTVGIVANERYNQLQASQGVYSIYPKEGMEAIERLFGSALRRIMVLKAADEVLKAFQIKQEQTLSAYPGKKVSYLREISPGFETMTANEAELREFAAAFEPLEQYCNYLVLDYFQKQGYFKEAHQTVAVLELRDKLGIIPKYYRLFEALLDLLTAGGFIVRQDNAVMTNERLSPPDAQVKLAEFEKNKEALLIKYPEIGSYFKLLEVCVHAYPRVLSGRQNYAEVMFPGNSTALVENIYKGNKLTDYYNQMVALTVKNYVDLRLSMDPAAQIRIVEVGAGTGGTSKFVLEALGEQARNVVYCYTDISLSFINHGKKVFHSYGYIDYRVLDIEKEIEAQGFEPHSMDLVLAANVIHATKNIENTLTNIKCLLKTNGILALNEITMRQSFATLTFGSTDGWWLYEDEQYRLKGSPALNSSTWKRIFEKMGFGVPSLVSHAKTESEAVQTVIIGASDGLVPKKNQKPAPRPPVHQTPKETIAPKAPPAKGTVTTPVSADNLEDKTIDYLKTVFAEILKMEKGSLENEATYENYGVDSLLVMEINKRLEKEFGKLPGTLLFEHITIRQLSRFFIQNHPDKLMELLGLRTNSPAITDEVFTGSSDLQFTMGDEKEFSKAPHLSTENGALRDYVYALSEEELDLLLNKFQRDPLPK